MKDEKIKIILADDHPLLRKGLKDIIDEQIQFDVIGEAGDGEEALDMIQKLNPHIAILDIHMPKLNGLEVVRLLRQKKINVELIILTMYDKENFFNRAMDLGIKGYIMKDSVLTEIVDAIKSVSEGKYYISSLMTGFLVKKSQFISDEGEDSIGISKLTTSERKILKMIAANLTTKEIAEELFLSIHTVETHRSNICQKLNLKGPNALLHFVLDHPNTV